GGTKPGCGACTRTDPIRMENAMHVTLNHRPMAGNPHSSRYIALIAALAALVGVIVLLCSSAAARAAETSAANFLKEAAQIDIAEIGAGKMAQQKSDNTAVRDFGSMLEL